MYLNIYLLYLNKMLKFIRYILGWSNEIVNLSVDIDSFVCVYTHTSLWDIFIYMLHMDILHKYKLNTFFIVKPQLKNWYYSPLLYLLNIYKNFIPIFAPSIHIKGTNSVTHISKQIMDKKDKSNYLIVISPKGTIKKQEWRSGYYYISKNLNIKIRPLFIDLTNRKLIIGNSIDPNINSLEECNLYLQSSLSEYISINQNNVEYTNNCIDYNKCCPYDSVLPFNLCTVTMFTFIPYIYKLYYLEYYFGSFISMFSFIVALFYHINGEYTYLYNTKKCDRYRLYETLSTKIVIIYQLFINISNNKPIFTLPILLTSFIGMFFYINSAPRGYDKIKGKYVLFHSFFHCMASITMLLLIS